MVLTSYETDADIVRAVDVGAIGYLLKDMQGPALLLALRDAAAGRTVLAPSVAMRLAARASTRAAQLTPREISILGLVRKGRANRQIGRELRIGEATVKTHLLHIFEKLGVHDRTSAVVTALERGVLRMEDG